jgi:hypothetical protein
MRYSLVRLLLLFSSFLPPACATYHISTQNLVEQMANSGTGKKTLGEFPITPLIHFNKFSVIVFYEGSVNGNDLRTVTCLDKNDKAMTLNVDNRTSVRITRVDHSRVTFYFNTLLIRDSTITGSKTHFFEAHITPVMLKDVSKIEIQKD